MKNSMLRYSIKLILLSGLSLFADQPRAITLSEAYQRALVYEAKLKSVAYQALAKDEDVKQAQSQLYPQIFASLDHSNRNYEDNFYKKNIKERYNSGGITASQILYHPEIIAQIESEKLKADSAKIYLTKQQQELAYKVADAYISILKYQNSVKIAESYVQMNQMKHRQIEEKLLLKLSNKMDFLESKLAYEEASILLQKQKSLLMLAKNRLQNLIGIQVEQMPIVEFETLSLERFFVLPSSQELSQNHDIKMGKLNTKVYEKELEVSKYGHYPKLDLSVSHVEYQTNDITVDYERDSRVMLEFKIPLYQGGRVEAQVEKSRLLLNASREDLLEQEREIQMKYEELLINYETAKETIVLQKNTKYSAQLYLTSIQKGYDYGLKSLIDLEDAKTKLYETKFKLVESIYNLITSYIAVLNITGKLSTDDLEKMNFLFFEI